jgi:cystathionine gamma-lyase
LAGLDNAKHALTFSSGVGVITTLFSMLQSGDDIIIADDVFGGSIVLFQ